MKEQNIPTRNQTISRLRKMHRRRISRLKPIIFLQQRENKQINLRFKHLKPQRGMALARSGVAWPCKEENDYLWNVNHFVQISIRDQLIVSHFQLDGK